MSREVQWLVNRQAKAKLEDEFQVFLKKSGGAGKEGYLLVGVNGHHPVKSTLQVGLEALRLAHHGFHGGKLFVKQSELGKGTTFAINLPK